MRRAREHFAGTLRRLDAAGVLIQSPRPLNPDHSASKNEVRRLGEVQHGHTSLEQVKLLELKLEIRVWATKGLRSLQPDRPPGSSIQEIKETFDSCIDKIKRNLLAVQFIRSNLEMPATMMEVFFTRHIKVIEHLNHLFHLVPEPIQLFQGVVEEYKSCAESGFRNLGARQEKDADEDAGVSRGHGSV